MPRRTLVCLAVSLLILGPMAAHSEEMSPAAKVASLADFVGKVETLENMVGDIVLSGALALLADDYPEWEFEAGSNWNAEGRGTSNVPADVAAAADYAMPKLRGKLVKNPVVSEEQTQKARQIFGAVQGLIVDAYAMDKLLEGDDKSAAALYYRETMLRNAEQVRSDMQDLADEIALAITVGGL